MNNEDSGFVLDELVKNYYVLNVEFEKCLVHKLPMAKENQLVQKSSTPTNTEKQLYSSSSFVNKC